MDRATAERMVASVPHWHHRFEVFPGVVTPGSYDPGFLWEKLGLDAKSGGTTALDIGPSDGFFTKKLADLGVEVTAVDYRQKDGHGFGVMEQLSGCSYNYVVENALSLTPEMYGTFDTVLLLGVLYHLPDPLSGLWIARRLCRNRLFLETWYEPDTSPDIAAARYWIGKTAFGDRTNFWSPNLQCVRDMLYDAGFDLVREEPIPGGRLFMEARISDAPGRLYKMQIAYSHF